VEGKRMRRRMLGVWVWLNLVWVEVGVDIMVNTEEGVSGRVME
jgi:hypothetical protein